MMNEEDLIVQNLYKQNKTQQKRIKELERVLKKHGIHTKDCFKVGTLSIMNCVTPEEAECTCGLEQAPERLRERQNERRKQRSNATNLCSP